MHRKKDSFDWYFPCPITQKARLSLEKRAFLLYGDFNVHPLSFMRQDIEGNRKAHV
jgi:hypothetical protein